MGASYEGLLLFGVLWLTGYAFSALAQFKGQPGGLRWAFQVYVALVLGAYFTALWSGGRRTLAMKTLDLRLLGPGDAPLSPARAAVRFGAAAALLVLPLGAAKALHPALGAAALLPFAWMLVDAQRRTLWDVVAGTRMATDA